VVALVRLHVELAWHAANAGHGILNPSDDQAGAFRSRFADGRLPTLMGSFADDDLAALTRYIVDKNSLGALAS
jgi:hypothetical protein